MQYSLTDQSTVIETLLDGTCCKLLLDGRAIKSFMSKQHYLRNKSFHELPKGSSKANIIQVRNQAIVNILFIIPIIITIQGHICEIYAMDSEIHDNVDPVLGVINIVVLETE